MTQLKIHGGNMAFHKRVAILVSLSGPTGGTATFSPAQGTSYSLSSLPIGSKIVKSSDSLYNITDSSNTVLGSITLTAGSGYTIGGIELNSQLVSSTPVTLSDGDILNPIFNMIAMGITFYNGGLGTFYNELTSQYIPDGGYADVPRADVLRFSPYSANNGIIEIYKDGLWIPVIDYAYNGKQAYVYAAPSSAGQVQPAEFVPESGNTYVFPALWGLQNGYQYLDGSTFAFQNPPASCALVDILTAGLKSTDYLKEFFINNVLYNNPAFAPVKQVMRWESPDGGTFNYVLFDGSIMYGMFYLDIMYVMQSGQYQNTRIYVPFTYDGGYMVCFPYEEQNQSGLFVPRQDTNLNRPASGFISDVFSYGNTIVLENWMSMWQCSDECEFISKISALANGYYQNL